MLHYRGKMSKLLEESDSLSATIPIALQSLTLYLYRKLLRIILVNIPRGSFPLCAMEYFLPPESITAYMYYIKDR